MAFAVTFVKLKVLIHLIFNLLEWICRVIVFGLKEQQPRPQILPFKRFSRLELCLASSALCRLWSLREDGMRILWKMMWQHLIVILTSYMKCLLLSWLTSGPSTLDFGLGWAVRVQISSDFSDHYSDQIRAQTMVWPWIQWTGFLLQEMGRRTAAAAGLSWSSARVTPQNVQSTTLRICSCYTAVLPRQTHNYNRIYP